MSDGFLPPVVAKLTGDDSRFTSIVDRAIGKADQFAEHVDKIGRMQATAKVALDDVEAKLRLSRFEDRLDDMRSKVATARVNADTVEGRRKLDAFDLQLRRLGLTTARPNVDLQGVARAELALEGLQLRLDALGDGGGRRGGGIGGVLNGGRNLGGGFGAGWLGLGIGAALPAAMPLAGVGLGVGAGALTAGVAGGIGLGAFGFAAKSSAQQVIKDADKLAKLTEKYNQATTDKQRVKILHQEAALWESLSPPQRAAVKNVTDLKTAWGDYQKQLQPTTFHVLADGASVFKTVLNQLEPAGKETGNAIDGLLQSADKTFKDPFWRDWFQFIGNEAPYYVNGLGSALGHLGEGAARLVQDFNPLGHDVIEELDRLSVRFDRWAAGSGPDKFVKWVEKEAPQAGKFLSDLAHAVGGLAGPLTSIGQIELTALTPVLKWIGDMSKQHPEAVKDIGLALLVVAAGVKAVNAASTVAAAITGVNALIGRYRVLGVTAGEAALAEGAAASGGSAVKGLGLLGGLATALGITNIIENQKKLPKNASVGDRVLNGVGSAMVLGTQPGELNPGRHDGPATLAGMSKSDWLGLIHNTESGGKKDGLYDPQGLAHALAVLRQYAKTEAGARAALAAVSREQENSARQTAVLDKFLVVNTGLAAANARAHQQAVSSVLAMLGRVPGALAQAEAQAKRGGVSIGKALDDGLTVAIKQGEGNVLLVSEQVIGNVLHVMKNKAQIASPSKATKAISADMIAGLLLGLESGSPAVYAAALKVTESALAGLSWVTGKDHRVTHGLSVADQAALRSMGLGDVANLTYVSGKDRRKLHHLTDAQLRKYLLGFEEKATSRAITHVRAGEALVDKAFRQNHAAGNLTGEHTDVLRSDQLLRVAQLLARVTVGLPDHVRALRELTAVEKDNLALNRAYLADLRRAHAHEAMASALVDRSLHSGGYLAHQAAMVVHVHGSIWTERELHHRLGTVARQFERGNTTNGMTRVRKTGQ